jgi:hypothetical protein
VDKAILVAKKFYFPNISDVPQHFKKMMTMKVINEFKGIIARISIDTGS